MQSKLVWSTPTSTNTHQSASIRPSLVIQYAWLTPIGIETKQINAGGNFTLWLVRLGCRPRWRPSAPGSGGGLPGQSAPEGRTSARPECTSPRRAPGWGLWVPLASWSPSGTRVWNISQMIVKTIRGFGHVTGDVSRLFDLICGCES